ncbi:hypothetical protein ACFYXH_24660 [Streptomyces sp. NPDC002730]|uniref:hypothetical protein n=1 Tax=Streptomyces sp. NPDC002730 TaxID=3364662 RepID=UPI0036D1D935
MYHAINVAVIDSIEKGIASSCSLMVPWSLALHAMHLLRGRPEITFGSTSRWSAIRPTTGGDRRLSWADADPGVASSGGPYRLNAGRLRQARRSLRASRAGFAGRSDPGL